MSIPTTAPTRSFLNPSDDFVRKGLEGLVLAYPDLLANDPAHGFIRRYRLTPGKVGLLSGGGSGHEPMHAGFVGPGMLDAACAGDLFSSPTPPRIVAAANAIDQGQGCLMVVKNYAGDTMNFDMATEALGDRVARVVVHDDVANDVDNAPTLGRGIAGTLVVEKILGAAAEAGMDLASLQALGQVVVDRTASLGVALSAPTLPGSRATRPDRILPGTMEFGVGIHGEPGVAQRKWMPPEELAEAMVDRLVTHLRPPGSSPLLLFVNGLGGTPALELWCMARAALHALERRGLSPQRRLVGSYVTSLDTLGCSLTLSVLDHDSLRLWDAPVHTAALRWGR